MKNSLKSIDKRDVLLICAIAQTAIFSGALTATALAGLLSSYPLLFLFIAFMASVNIGLILWWRGQIEEKTEVETKEPKEPSKNMSIDTTNFPKDLR